MAILAIRTGSQEPLVASVHALSQVFRTGRWSDRQFVAALHALSGTRGTQSLVRGGFDAVRPRDTQSSDHDALSVIGIHTHTLQHVVTGVIHIVCLDVGLSLVQH